MKIRLVTRNFYAQVEEMFLRIGFTDFGVFSEQEPKPDLLVFSGGADISPEIYGEINVGESGVNPSRDRIEISAYRYAKVSGIPCFGICRGHQLLNALEGGRLIQNIKEYHPDVHTLSTGVVVNSYHHQGVIYTPLTILATFGNIAEITAGNKVFSVQFHPEFAQDPEMDLIVQEGLKMLW
jgi:gamma-glutamyl-gamma-aminobutyrate hydrolase PuuD